MSQNALAENTCEQGEICQSTPGGSSELPRRYRQPEFRVTQHDGFWQVVAKLPGVARSGVSITMEQGVLEIIGRREPIAADGWKLRYQEIPGSDYRLRLNVNAPIDEECIEARSENGELLVKLPVAEAAKPRKIAIR